MRIIYSLIVLSILPGILSAQSFVFPKFGRPVGSAAELAMQGWAVLDSVSGDLNKDEWEDMAVVLEYADSVHEQREDSVRFHRPRVLLILFRDTTGDSYRVVCQNNTFILRADEGWLDGDPFDEMEVENGVLWVTFHFTRADDAYKFRCQKGDFYLIGATRERHWANAMEKYDVNLSTGRSEHYWTDPDLSHKAHDVWKAAKPVKIRLRDIKDPSSLDIF